MEEKRGPLHVEVIEPERDTLICASAEGISRLSEKKTTSLSDGAEVGKPEPCKAEARAREHTENIQDSAATLSQLGLDPSLIQRGNDNLIIYHIYVYFCSLHVV